MNVVTLNVEPWNEVPKKGALAPAHGKPGSPPPPAEGGSGPGVVPSTFNSLMAQMIDYFDVDPHSVCSSPLLESVSSVLSDDVAADDAFALDSDHAVFVVPPEAESTNGALCEVSLKRNHSDIIRLPLPPGDFFAYLATPVDPLFSRFSYPRSRFATHPVFRDLGDVKKDLIKKQGGIVLSPTDVHGQVHVFLESGTFLLIFDVDEVPHFWDAEESAFFPPFTD